MYRYWCETLRHTNPQLGILKSVAKRNFKSEKCSPVTERAQRVQKNLHNSKHTCKVQCHLFWYTNTRKNQSGTLSTGLLQISRRTLNLSFVNHATLKLGLQSRGRASFGASANAWRVWSEESSLYSTWNTTLKVRISIDTYKWFVEEVYT